MKVVFVSVALVCANLFSFGAGNASGNQVCAPPGTSINIDVHGGVKDLSKPSAHIESGKGASMSYQLNKVIKDWSISAHNNANSHLSGGMMYADGELIVPTPGRYYIYAQIYYHNNGRVYVRVNNKVVLMMQPPSHGNVGHGTSFTGGVFNLKAGDSITVASASSQARIYMGNCHSYFGAYLI